MMKLLQRGSSYDPNNNTDEGLPEGVHKPMQSATSTYSVRDYIVIACTLESLKYGQ